jgi:hypothetical protein
MARREVLFLSAAKIGQPPGIPIEQRGAVCAAGGQLDTVGWVIVRITGDRETKVLGTRR